MLCIRTSAASVDVVACIGLLWILSSAPGGAKLVTILIISATS